jgi:diguanylate cyclase (GGDEF)-like protein
MQEMTRGRRTNLGSFIVDGRGTILGFDEALEALTRWRAIEIVGRNKDLAPPADGEPAGLAALPFYEGQIPVDRETRNVRLTLNCHDERCLDVEGSLKPLAGPGHRTVVTVRRILARSARRSAASHLQACDPLTGLTDRQGFALRLAEDFREAVSAARPLGLIVLDIDHLREINDRRGHAAGDAVLQKLAGILRVACDDERRIARVGDDDFAILLPGGGRGEARQLAASLRSIVERHPFFETGPGPATHPADVTLSLGSASFPADASTERELYERAYEALTEARSMGRNRVWCYLRRPRVPVQVPVFFDGAEPLLVGYTRDLSPSGVFVQTTESIDVGMRCALAFPLPGHDSRVHVVGRVVRTVFPDLSEEASEVRVPGLGIEFERFGGVNDRHAIDVFLHGHEELTLRPETGQLSVSGEL